MYELQKILNLPMNENNETTNKPAPYVPSKSLKASQSSLDTNKETHPLVETR
jgi:hypothetical protein